jgi:hypothetical protein
MSSAFLLLKRVGWRGGITMFGNVIEFNVLKNQFIMNLCRGETLYFYLYMYDTFKHESSCFSFDMAEQQYDTAFNEINYFSILSKYSLLPKPDQTLKNLYICLEWFHWYL